MIREALARAAHGILRWREARARQLGQHDRALELLRRELYADFSRPMAAIHLDMAWERLALGKADEATALLKLADEARLDDPARVEKRLLVCWALVEQGKAAEADTRLRAMEGEPMQPVQARRRRELLAEASLARKAPEAAREVCGEAPDMLPWRIEAEAEDNLRQGDRAAAGPRLEQVRALLATRPDAPWLRRRVDRLLRDRK